MIELKKYVQLMEINPLMSTIKSDNIRWDDKTKQLKFDLAFKTRVDRDSFKNWCKQQASPIATRTLQNARDIFDRKKDNADPFATRLSITEHEIDKLFAMTDMNLTVTSVHGQTDQIIDALNLFYLVVISTQDVSILNILDVSELRRRYFVISLGSTHKRHIYCKFTSEPNFELYGDVRISFSEVIRLSKFDSQLHIQLPSRSFTNKELREQFAKMEVIVKRLTDAVTNVNVDNPIVKVEH